MAQTPPPTITAAPTPPIRGNRATFSGLVDAFVTWLIAAVSQFSAVATNCYNNAVDAFNSASNSASSAAAAEIQANAAVSGVNAAAWVSGTTYTVGSVRYSPADFRTYRRTTAGAGTTDPSFDTANWLLVSTAPQHAALLATLTTTAAVYADFLSIFSAGYDYYVVTGHDILPQGSGGNLRVWLANSGAVDATDVYFTSSTSANHFDMFPVDAGGRGATFVLRVAGVNSANSVKSLVCEYASQSSTSYPSGTIPKAYTRALTVSGLRLHWSGGTNFVAGGKLRVYGFKNS